MKESFWAVLLIWVGLVQGWARADVAWLAPVRDNTLYQDPNGELSNGSGEGLFVGQNHDGGFIRRAMLAFDLPGKIPAGSTIHSVTLTLHLSRTSSGYQAISLHRLQADWGEGGSMADNGSGGGSGGHAAPGDATWLYRFYPGQPWQVPGGDFVAAPSASCEVNDIGFYTWGTTGPMAADVQAWVDNPQANCGWILIGQESGTQTSKRLDSRETQATEYQPMLTVSFTPQGGCTQHLAGDLNGDCRVDLSDMALLASQWLVDTSQPAAPGSVDIQGVGRFTFDPDQVPTLRPEVFRPGHFSAFDVLVHLNRQGRIQLAYHYSDTLATHVIDSLNAKSNWWYEAHYDGGGFEENAFRMDLYPFKERMEIRLEQVTQSKLDKIYASFTGEVVRMAANGGQVIIPEVTITGKTFNLSFKDVLVQAHDLRSDTFQPGVITAVDAILSLADQGKITCDLQWYDSIGTAGVVRSYWVQQINTDLSTGRCGFVYQTGGDKSFGIANRIHLPSDWRVLDSPVYMQWDWLELGSCQP